MSKIDFKELGKRIGLEIPKELEILNFIDLGEEIDVLHEGTDFNINGYKYKVNKKEWHKDIIIDKFFPLKKLEFFWNLRAHFDKKYFGIASVQDPFRAFIVISLNKEDFGSIWLEVANENDIKLFEVNDEIYDDDDFEGYFRFFLQDNFISFLANLERFIFEDRINIDKSLSMLYKNWGEDFWRYREGKEES